MSDKIKKSARELQKRTGWSYMECRRCVTTMDGQAIEVLIKIRQSESVRKCNCKGK